MPKGEYDTPGPYMRMEDVVRLKAHPYAVALLEKHTDEAERDELVSLLNKGTHFDGLLAAIKVAGCICGVSIGDPRARSHSKQCNDLDAAQRAAEGKEPEPVSRCMRCSGSTDKLFPLDGATTEGVDIRVCGPCIDYLAEKYGGPDSTELDRRATDAQ